MTLAYVALAAVILVSAITAVLSRNLLRAAVALGVGSAALATLFFLLDAASSAELGERLAQVSWKDYFAERARYEQRQEQFRRRYRWRHHRDAVLQQRVTDWAEAVSDC